MEEERAQFYILNSIFCIPPYTVVKRFRPFWRRAFKTSRPFFVSDRTRKPWVVARFFFFGWYVCDIVETLYTILLEKSSPCFYG